MPDLSTFGKESALEIGSGFFGNISYNHEEGAFLQKMIEAYRESHK
jgi:hypothetical protein